MSRKTTVFLLVGLTGALLLTGIYLARPVSAQMPAGGNMPKMLTLSVEGNFRVHYSCAFHDNSVQKKDKQEQVKRIEFHPEYIVLFGQTGDGRVIPVYSIKELTWEQS